jgi:LysR family glycine cleavage system transcriptional activator
VLRRLVSHKESTEIVGSRVTDDPALLADGGLDALLRTSDESCAGLHIDRIIVRGGDAEGMPAILVTRPGIAGCRQHRNLLKLLRT